MAGFKFPSESDTPIVELKFDYPQFQKIIKNWLIKHYSTIIVTSVECVVAAVIAIVIVNVIVFVIQGSLRFIYAYVLATGTYGETLLKMFQEVEPMLCMLFVYPFIITSTLFIAIKLSFNKDLRNLLRCTSLVPIFSNAFMIALDTSPKKITAISMGLLSGLIIGGLSKLEDIRLNRLKHSEEELYNELTDLLSTFDTDNHKNKVKSESITNSPVSLVDNRDLQEVKDPIGDEQITLDYTLRDKEVEIEGEQYVLLGYQKNLTL